MQALFNHPKIVSFFDYSKKFAVSVKDKIVEVALKIINFLSSVFSPLFGGTKKKPLNERVNVQPPSEKNPLEGLKLPNTAAEEPLPSELSLPKKIEADVVVEDEEDDEIISLNPDAEEINLFEAAQQFEEMAF